MNECAECGRVRPNKGRGLCSVCYGRHLRTGTLHQFPRRLHRREDIVEDYQFLARQGYTRRLAAERLGITKKALEKALERDRRARAVAS